MMQQELVTAAFVRVLDMDPQAAFASHPALRVNRVCRTDDSLPQPGFVGSHYRYGGLLLVGMNPGGGSNVGMETEAIVEERILLGIRAGQVSMSEAMADMEICKRAWPYWRNVVIPAAVAAGYNLGEVAHLNLFPFRTVGQKLPTALVQHFRPMFDDLVAALRPSVMIACGIGTADYMRKAGLKPDVVLPRTRGDTGQASGFAEALRQIKALACRAN